MPRSVHQQAVRFQREPETHPTVLSPSKPTAWRVQMGKGILLWLIGIPIPIILLILLFWH
ncbi:hypothetical protein [Sphingomonas sp. KR3-1]|uniref:hypothetical protein n=1 Tax=Sphingomonas sp. KR3-1 TaxID=3156611 RepID=UPI0032B4B3F0